MALSAADRELHDAISRADVDRVKSALDNGADMEAITNDVYRNTALHLLARKINKTSNHRPEKSPKGYLEKLIGITDILFEAGAKFDAEANVNGKLMPGKLEIPIFHLKKQQANDATKHFVKRHKDYLKKRNEVEKDTAETTPLKITSPRPQTYTVGKTIDPLVLPEATGGQPPYKYSLTPPSGMKFDANKHELSGAPETPSSEKKYEYKVSDGIGGHASVQFNITVQSVKHPLNQIFYGPPGTGKTYNTIDTAVKIIDGSSPGTRDVARDRYQDLVKQGRIAFLTFHQNYGYEEFVEGIRPDFGQDGKGDIRYVVADGVFKKMVTNAKGGAEAAAKIAAEAAAKATSIASGSIVEAIAKFDDGNRSSTKAITEASTRATTAAEEAENKSAKTQKLLSTWIDKVAKRNSGDKSKLVSELTRKLSQDNPDVDKLISEYAGKLSPSDDNVQDSEQPENFVLIIDEINRGNVSNIFGELITLIEESRRLGSGKEETTVTLPYSGEIFSVPNNLYIIGTMNTADRSITRLDTALRRRFHFVEMMPEYDAKGTDGKPLLKKINGVCLACLLKTMNKRVRQHADYGREQQIGHSYFIDVEDEDKVGKDVETRGTLANVFRHQIIPLLQEYFYNEYEVINKVLGDDNPGAEWFLREDPWEINDDGNGNGSPFEKIENYRKILSVDHQYCGGDSCLHK